MPMVTVSISPQLADYIRSAVDEGEYASSSEVVRDALQLLGDTRKDQSLGSRVEIGVAHAPADDDEREHLCVADLFAAYNHRPPPRKR